MSEETKPEGGSTYETPPNGFRTFLIIWITQSVSVFGSALTFFAINIWLITTLYPLDEQKPQLAGALAAVNVAFAGATMIFATIAGAWADRHDRKRTMMAMDFASGCLSLTLMVLVLNNQLQLWILVIIAILLAITSAFHGSAFDTSYAMLVPEKQLPRANGMMQTIWSLSGIISPGIAAFLISVPGLARQHTILGDFGLWLGQFKDGTPLTMMIDAATFFVASAALTFLHVPSPKRTDLITKEGKKKSLWSDVKQGAIYIWHRRPMLWLLGTFTAINFVGSTTGTIEPLLVKFNLAPDWQAQHMEIATALAILGMAGAIGGLVGGIFISTWGGLKKRRIYGVVIPILIVGVSTIVFGLSPFLYLTAAMAFIITGMTPIMNAHSQTIWQTQVPRELQGRVFSVRRVIAQFTWPLGAVVAGLVGGLFDPGMVMAVLGVALTIFCIGQLFNPYLRRVEDKAWLDQLAAERAGLSGAAVEATAPEAQSDANTMQPREDGEVDEIAEADEPEEVGTPRR